MKHSLIRSFAALSVALLAALFGSFPCAAQAQAYPARPIKIVVPFGPGSGTDVVARLIGEELRGELGATIVIENKPGASGIIGVDSVAKAPADGHTLLVTTVTTISANPFLFKKLPYDPVKDFQPIANFVETQMVLLVRADAPFRSLRELSEWLKANPNQAAFGHGSGVSQIAAASYVRRIGATANAVSYKSSPQALTDLVGGQFPFMFLDMTTAITHVKAGRVRALAVSGERRLAELPGVPTLIEAGLPGFSVVAWCGIFAPAGTPAEIVARVSDALLKILDKPALRERISAAGVVSPMGPKQFTGYLAAQRIAWGELIREAGIERE